MAQYDDAIYDVSTYDGLANKPANTVAADFYEALEPLAYDDERRGYPLLNYINAISLMLAPLEAIVRDAESGPGWSALLDPYRIPNEQLEWLAQFTGVRIPTGLPESQRRSLVASQEGWHRGTLGAIRSAAQRHLTGGKNVIIRERDGSAYRLTVITFASETPDPARVHAALVDQKPAGLVMTHSVLTGQDFQLVRENFANFGDLRNAYANFEQMRSDSPI